MDKIIKEVLEKINSYGFETYLVGGYPRDSLLYLKTDDFDICTSAKKDDLEKIFETKFQDNFGSIILNYKKYKFEITTYRQEIKYEGVRTPSIVYTSKLEEDILRRDFTINAICMDSEGNLIDLVDGVNDVKSKVIRMIGNPNEKLNDDPLRILRAIRLSSVLDFSIDSDLESAILLNSHKVKELSYFRKKQELDKIFVSENFEKGINLLKKYNLLDFLDIKVKTIIPASRLGIWSQIDYSSKYPFNKEELNIIFSIRKLTNKGTIDNYDLYFYDKKIILEASKILKLDLDTVNKRYLNLPIHNRKDIKISYIEIINNTKLKPNKVYKILEHEILDNGLINDSKILITYLRNLDFYNIDK